MSASSRELGVLGPYVLLEQIAIGGMAEIYMAKTRGVAGFEKLLCLKVIHPNYADDEHFIEMLIDEAKIAVGLNHVNIVQIFDLGRDGRTYFIAMEYIDGADLFKIMRRLSEKDFDVPIDVAAFVAQEICTGLDYAHRKRDEQGRPLGIIHRDISPQNILISTAGEVKIVDFGIAKAASRSRKTQAGVIKGKYYYMSPEQAWGDPVDQRTDIFSTGIILYEVLTGQMLYLEEDMHRLVDMVRKADIPRPSTRRPDIPPQLETIVMKSLAKRPADRWQTAHEFQAALTNFLFSHAPAFTPSRVARLLETALAEGGEAPAPAARPATKQVQLDELMSRVDFRPPTEHSVIFRISDLSDGSDITAETKLPGPSLPDEGEEPPEEAGERTVISGPPTMMDPRARPDLRQPPAAQRAREAKPAEPRQRGPRQPEDWEVDEGPTFINKNTVPPRPDSAEAGSGRPRRNSRSLPVEIVLSPALAPQPGLSPVQLAPTPPPDPQETTQQRPLGGAPIDAEGSWPPFVDETATAHPSGAAGPPPPPVIRVPVRPTGPLPSVGPPPPNWPPLAPSPMTPPPGLGWDPTPPPGPQRWQPGTLTPPPGAPASPQPPAPTAWPPSTPAQAWPPPSTPPQPWPTTSTPQQPQAWPTTTTPPQLHTWPPTATPPQPPMRPPSQLPSGAPPHPVWPPVAIPAQPPAWPPAAAPLGSPPGWPPVGLPQPAPVDPRWPSSGWPSPGGSPSAPTTDPGTFGPSDLELEQAQVAERRRRRWRNWALLTVLLAVVLGGAGGVVLFLMPPTEEGGRVNVISVPEGASVIFDGVLLSKVAPVVIPVSDLTRPHTLEVQMKNYKPYKRVVTFGAGETSQQEVAVLTAIFGRLEVKSTPAKAEVYIDGQHRGRTPLVIENLTPSGELTLELRHRGYVPVSEVLRWEDRTFLSRDIPLKRSP